MEQAKLLIIFATVLKYGSMNAAAPHLRMTASAVSQAIRKLEDFYQIKLLHRTTRKLTPTEAGNIIWKYAEQIDRTLQHAEEEIQALRTEPMGEVRLTMPTAYSQHPFIQRAVQALLERYPKIRLVLEESEKIIDLWTENAPDIAIRVVMQLDNENLIARPLATWQTMLCASPDYLAKYPIEKAQDLLDAHWLNYHSGILQKTLAQLGLPNDLPIDRTDFPNNANTARVFARLGAGVTILQEGDIADDLANGTLLRLLPQMPLPKRTIYATTANRTQSAKIQAVLSVLAEVFGQG